jgi:hypothetical protein
VPTVGTNPEERRERIMSKFYRPTHQRELQLIA